MGYTHYFKFKGNTITPTQFANIVKDVKEIEKFFKHTPVKSQNAGGGYNEHLVTLHDGWGKRKGIHYIIEEIAGKQKVVEFMLNGTDKGDLGHETFNLKLGKQEELSGFCKTARKPYDLAVTMILISAKYFAPDTEIGSDGNIEDWEHGIELWKQIFSNRYIEVGGLTKEQRDLTIIELDRPVKKMKGKKGFNHDDKRVEEEYKEMYE